MCIAGEDIWHLDCEHAREAAGVRTGEPCVSVNHYMVITFGIT